MFCQSPLLFANTHKIYRQKTKFLSTQDKAMYFEEFTPGLTITTQTHLITAQDIDTFAKLSGDNNPIHVDAAFAATTIYEQRIAHGLLIASLVSGLAVGTGLASHLIVSRQIQWKFLKPFFIGDSIYAEIGIKQTRPIPRLGNGLVIFWMKVFKQPAELAATGLWEALAKTAL